MVDGKLRDIKRKRKQGWEIESKGEREIESSKRRDREKQKSGREGKIQWLVN